MEKRIESCEISRPHVALYPAVSEGLGHLIPFLEFARKLVSSHGFALTLITPALTVYPTQAKYVSELLASNPNRIHQVELPDIPLDEEDTKDDATKAFLAKISKSMPAVEQNLRILQQPNSPFSPVCALISDLFNAESLDVADRLGLPNYVLFTCSAAFLSFMFSAPRLFMSDGNEASPVSVNMPGWKKPFREGDFPDPFRNKSAAIFDGFLRLCSPLRAMKAILVNTFHDLEAQTIHALLSGSVGEIDRPPRVHAIGPITRLVDLPQADGEGEERLKVWLDRRPKASVVFASFGTWGLMSTEQLREIALGLEASGLNFVWVVRGISNSSDARPTSRIGSSFELELSSVLPEGFMTRVEGRGLVVPSWAPQVAILSHPAVRAFVSHCGWNSVLEAIWFGVPIVAWPLYAEQRMNCLLVVDEWMVGLEAVKRADGLVGRTELQSVLEQVMDGEEGRLVRKNIEELSLKARFVVTEKEGSSFASMKLHLAALLKSLKANTTTKT